MDSELLQGWKKGDGDGMNQYEAISYRRSVRKFDFTPVPEALMKKVNRFIQELSPWNREADWKLEILDNINRRAPVRGFGVVHAPYYLVFYGERVKEGLENAGYMLEQMVLYLTTKGLGCCYQGCAKVLGEKRTDSLKALMVVAFGYPARRLLRDGAVAKRHPLKELCIFKEEAGEEIKSVLYAARMAPSAFNSQPWRFVVYKNKIHIFVRKKSLLEKLGMSMREINIGIVLCHMQLAAEEQWLFATFAPEDKIRELNMKKMDYITTFSLKTD